jgi:protein-S-isoprenylcysteine O-methyltransferase Ste14
MLIDEMERSGRWLFRYRNHLPLVLVPLILLALGQSGGIESTFGTAPAMAWRVLCITVVLAGFVLRCVVVGYCPPGASGRNSQTHRAVSLNRRGAYSVVRNPLYLANFLIIVGEVSLVEVWWLTLVVVLGFWLYYERIMIAEESFLESGFGDHYRLWANSTPAFIPDPTRWSAPRRAFSIKKVVANESPTLTQIVVVITLIQIACDWVVWHRVQPRGVFLIGLSVVSLIVYFVLRAIRKNTRWLSTSPAGGPTDRRPAPMADLETALREE